MRQKLARHRENPTCAACHNLMDPIGFALENYDWLGRGRDTDNGLPIDASAKLPSGESFNGPIEFRQVLMNRKDESHPPLRHEGARLRPRPLAPRSRPVHHPATYPSSQGRQLPRPHPHPRNRALHALPLHAGPRRRRRAPAASQKARQREDLQIRTAPKPASRADRAPLHKAYWFLTSGRRHRHRHDCRRGHRRRRHGCRSYGHRRHRHRPRAGALRSRSANGRSCPCRSAR